MTITLLCLLTLLSPQARAGHANSMPTDDGDGRVAWFGLATTNLAQSKEFYGKLFGWTYASVSGSDQAAEITSATGRSEPFGWLTVRSVLQWSCLHPGK